MPENWRKATYSQGASNCVEVATWRKSSYSTAYGQCVEAATWREPCSGTACGQCAEAGHSPGIVGVRDSKLGSLALEFSTAAWAAFTRRLR